MKARLAVGIWATLLALAATTGFAAAPASAAGKGGVRYEARLGVHRGYRINLDTTAKKVEVEIVKDNAYHHSGQAVAIYSVPGQISEHGLRADFGPFGEIDTRFDVRHRAGGEIEQGRNCRYRSALTLDGRLRGTIRLPAQGDFLDFSTHSVAAHFVHRFPNDCPPAEVIHGPGPEPEEVARASASESAGGSYKAIVVSFGHDGRRRTFFEDETSKDAAPALTGPLTISLPGAPDVPLTGPNNLVDLCAKYAESRCRLEDPDD